MESVPHITYVHKTTTPMASLLFFVAPFLKFFPSSSHSLSFLRGFCRGASQRVPTPSCMPHRWTSKKYVLPCRGSRESRGRSRNRRNEYRKDEGTREGKAGWEKNRIQPSGTFIMDGICSTIQTYARFYGRESILTSRHTIHPNVAPTDAFSLSSVALSRHPKLFFKLAFRLSRGFSTLNIFQGSIANKKNCGGREREDERERPKEMKRRS